MIAHIEPVETTASLCTNKIGIVVVSVGERVKDKERLFPIRQAVKNAGPALSSFHVAHRSAGPDPPQRRAQVAPTLTVFCPCPCPLFATDLCIDAFSPLAH
jgi:hypothetical protein